MPIPIMPYISVFCKHIETYLNMGYNLVLSATSADNQRITKFTHEITHDF